MFPQRNQPFSDQKLPKGSNVGGKKVQYILPESCRPREETGKNLHCLLWWIAKTEEVRYKQEQIRPLTEVV